MEAWWIAGSVPVEFSRDRDEYGSRVSQSVQSILVLPEKLNMFETLPCFMDMMMI